MEVLGYKLVNAEKVYRVINGAPGRDGNATAALGKNYKDEDLLAHYDKLGGAIYKGSDRVKMGSFWDFKGKKPHEKPQVSFVYRINGKVVEVADGVELPGDVKAARQLAAEEAVEVTEEAEEKPKKRTRK